MHNSNTHVNTYRNLEFLNKNFVAVDNTHWADEKGTMKVHLYTDDPDRNVYCISYIVLSLVPHE